MHIHPRSSTAVYAKLPRTGLGNMLFVWARAEIFARLNQGELFVSSWTKFRLGPFLRGERSKRLYFGSLVNDGVLRRLRLFWFRLSRGPVRNPPLEMIDPHVRKQYLYQFDAIAGDPRDPFRAFIPHHDFLRRKLEERLVTRVRDRLAGISSPVVGIHVRRGDFKQTSWLTPIEYFCDRLRNVRTIAGCVLPATVFTDGTPAEVAPLLNMPDVQLSPRQPEVLDLLQLSLSDVMIVSKGSTFGMWAGFLSRGIIIGDSEWNHAASRPADINRKHYEGGPDMDPEKWPELLKANLRELTKS